MISQNVAGFQVSIRLPYSLSHKPHDGAQTTFVSRNFQSSLHAMMLSPPLRHVQGEMTWCGGDMAIHSEDGRQGESLR